MNSDTQTSPGIGALGSAFSVLGGCVIDLVGTNGKRVTAQISAGRMFAGWVGGAPHPFMPVPGLSNWLVVGSTSFDATALSTALGGGITKANIRITLYDGDSGSPNPVYVAMFGAGNVTYQRYTPPGLDPQPGDYDFDGGQYLYFGFQDASGNPVNCGYMGETTTYRLDADGNTIGTFTGFPGLYALTDPLYVGYPHPSQYMTPVQSGASPGVWPVTGWFSVPDDSLATLWTVLQTGTLRLGVYDVSPGDQYYDFTQGLAKDVLDIPFTGVPSKYTLDLWVWRQLHQFTTADQDLNFPPGFAKALMYALAVEFFDEYPAAGKKYSLEDLENDAEAAVADLETLNASDAVAVEPQI